MKRWTLLFILIGKFTFSQTLPIVYEGDTPFIPVVHSIEKKDTSLFYSKIKKAVNEFENKGYPTVKAEITIKNDTLFTRFYKGPYKRFKSFTFNVQPSYYKKVFHSLEKHDYSFKKIKQRMAFLKQRPFVQEIEFSQLRFYSQSFYCSPHFEIIEKNSKGFEGFIYYEDSRLSGFFKYHNSHLFHQGLGLNFEYEHKNQKKSKTELSFSIPLFLYSPSEHEITMKQNRYQESEQHFSLASSHRFLSFEGHWSYSLRLEARLINESDPITNEYQRSRFYRYGFFAHYERAPRFLSTWGVFFSHTRMDKKRRKLINVQGNIYWEHPIWTTFHLSTELSFEHYLEEDNETPYLIEIDMTGKTLAYPYIEGFTNRLYYLNTGINKSLAPGDTLTLELENILYEKDGLTSKHDINIKYTRNINSFDYQLILSIPLENEIGDSYFYFLIKSNL